MLLTARAGHQFQATPTNRQCYAAVALTAATVALCGVIVRCSHPGRVNHQAGSSRHTSNSHTNATAFDPSTPRPRQQGQINPQRDNTPLQALLNESQCLRPLNFCCRARRLQSSRGRARLGASTSPWPQHQTTPGPRAGRQREHPATEPPLPSHRPPAPLFTPPSTAPSPAISSALSAAQLRHQAGAHEPPAMRLPHPTHSSPVGPCKTVAPQCLHPGRVVGGVRWSSVRPLWMSCAT